MQGKLKNDEDFGIDGRIQVILLKRNSNDFTITVHVYTAQRVLSVVCDVLSVLNPQVDICLHRLSRMIAARIAARRSGSARETLVCSHVF